MLLLPWRPAPFLVTLPPPLGLGRAVWGRRGVGRSTASSFPIHSLLHLCLLPSIPLFPSSFSVFLALALALLRRTGEICGPRIPKRVSAPPPLRMHLRHPFITFITRDPARAGPVAVMAMASDVRPDFGWHLFALTSSCPQSVLGLISV